MLQESRCIDIVKWYLFSTLGFCLVMQIASLKFVRNKQNFYNLMQDSFVNPWCVFKFSILVEFKIQSWLDLYFRDNNSHLPWESCKSTTDFESKTIPQYNEKNSQVLKCYELINVLKDTNSQLLQYPMDILHAWLIRAPEF